MDTTEVCLDSIKTEAVAGPKIEYIYTEPLTEQASSSRVYSEDEYEDMELDEPPGESPSPQGKAKSKRGAFQLHREIAEKIETGQYSTVVNTSGKSAVWEIFVQIKDDSGAIIPNLAQCARCKAVIKSRNTTSSYIRHPCFKEYIESSARARKYFCNYCDQVFDKKNLLANHIFECVKGPDPSINAERRLDNRAHIAAVSNPKYHGRNRNHPQTEKIVEKLKQKVYRLSRKKIKGHSKAWDYFYRILDENGERLPDFVCCKLCLRVVFKQLDTTSSLVRHPCVVLQLQVGSNPSEPVAEECDEFTIDFLDQRSEESAFTHSTAFEHLNVGHEMIAVITAWLIEDCVPVDVIEGAGFKKLVKFLSEAGRRSEGPAELEEMIPSRQVVEENIRIMKDTATVCLKDDLKAHGKGGVAIAAHLTQDESNDESYLGLSVNYNESNQIINRALAVKIGRKMSESQMESELSSIVRQYELDMLESCPPIVCSSDSPIQNILEIHKKVNCFSSLFNQVLSASIANSKPIKSLVQDLRECAFINNIATSGRNTWTSLYHTVEDVVKLEPGRRTMFSYDLLLQLNKFLAVFKKALDFLEGLDYPTIHMVHPYVALLQSVCDENVGESFIIQEFKRQVSLSIGRLVIPQFTDIHRIAVVLNPPTRQLLSFSDTERLKIHQLVKDEMAKMVRIESNTMDFEQSSIYNVLHERNDRKNRSNEMVNDEFARYQCGEFKEPSDERALLKWWDDRKVEFPLLYKVSAQILTVPASSARVEGMVNKLRWLSECRQRQIGSVGDLAFMNCNKDFKIHQ